MPPTTFLSLEAEIDHALSTHQNNLLEELLKDRSSDEIARVINRFGHGKRKIFRYLPIDLKRQVIWDLNQFSRKYIVIGMTNDQLRELLEEMDSDDASDIVYLLPERRQQDVLKALNKEDSQNITAILQYPENSAGHVMQKELIKVPEYFSVLDSVRRVQRAGDITRHTQSIFVTDAKGKFLGTVPITELILRPPKTKVKELIVDTTSVPVAMDQEEVAHLFKDKDLAVLPVTDASGKLVGKITADDIVDVIEAEQSEDMYQMAGVSTDESVFDPPLHAVKGRMFWLTVNLATAILAAGVVALFQGTIQKVAILAAYMPIVAGMGGNAATQVITVVVRSIALQEIQFRDASKVLIKEGVIGVLNGLILGVITGLLSYFYNGSIMLGVVIALAMIINLLIAGISGTLIPLILKSLHLDPALASTVFVTTCTDVGGFFSFLALATILL